MPLINHTENEKMGPLMKAIKAVHSVTAGQDTAEALKRQRASMELFSRLVTPSAGIRVEGFQVGEIPCELITPDFAHRSDRIILYCHGGGYTCGGLGYARILADKLALAGGLPVVSFEYRLAPEHPYPAAPEDAMAVYDYLLHQGYGSREIILCGDSAGGNLALELCLQLKAENRIQPRAMVLFSPWTDMRCTASAYEKYKEVDPLITREYVEMVRTAYAGMEADFNDPGLSPLLADLDGLPPTLVQVGSNEILRGDSEILVKRMISAGCHARLEIYKGGWHVFQQMPILRATHAMEKAGEFILSL